MLIKILNFTINLLCCLRLGHTDPLCLLIDTKTFLVAKLYVISVILIDKLCKLNLYLYKSDRYIQSLASLPNAFINFSILNIWFDYLLYYYSFFYYFKK